MSGGKQPIFVLTQNTKREIGRKAQLANIQAGKTISEIVRTTLGPKSMLKMLLDPLGGIVITNDGNAILREVDVSHPAAKSMIELSRSQDEEVGDGTTSVIVLTGELLAVSENFLKKKMHPTVIVNGYLRALEDTLKIMEDVAVEVDLNDTEAVQKVVDSCLNTKFSSRWGPLISSLAVDAVKKVCIPLSNGRKEIDIKRYAKIEKIPGGELEECKVLDGIMLNKDITHPKMRRMITNPKILLLDCPLEYKKGESQTNVEITKEEDWSKLLEQEEIEVKKMCQEIIDSGCDLVVTEKGVSDLAQHYFVKANITCIRRVRKMDNNRLARVSGATICNRTEEINQCDIGKKCGLFEIKKIGDEYHCFFTKCIDPHACTIMLRGASKDVLNEIERNLQDAMNVARNVMMDAKLLPGGGAIEMELSARLNEKANSLETSAQFPYRAAANAFEVIPRTLSQNCGSNVVRVLTDLRSRHAKSNKDGAYMGIDGNSGEVVDMRSIGVWDTLTVKQQIFKTAIEASSMLLRIDEVLSGMKKDEANSQKKIHEEGPVMEDIEV